MGIKHVDNLVCLMQALYHAYHSHILCTSIRMPLPLQALMVCLSVSGKKVISCAVTNKIELAKELVDKLISKSGDLDWKVEDIEGEVDTLKCGFDSLKEDVTVLESARSELLAQTHEIGSCLEEHAKQGEADTSEIQTSLNNTKSALSILEGFVHPCGGSGWHKVAYHDFRDINTHCPQEWQLLTSHPEKPYTCGRLSTGTECDTTSFPVRKEYSKVCGRIRAYQVGIMEEFVSSPNVNILYLDGISITHGGDLGNAGGVPATHIWSFAAANSELLTTQAGRRCPCNGGSNLPSFVGEDYFCETAIKGSTTGLTGQILTNDILWDGKGCLATSGCCSRVDGPYFIKQLETKTTDDIDVRICTGAAGSGEDIAVELIEIYVQ